MFRNLMVDSEYDFEVMKELNEAGVTEYVIGLKPSPANELPTTVFAVLGCWYDWENFRRSIKLNKVFSDIKLLENFSITGEDIFARYILTRYWNYWVIKGAVPYKIAKEIYDDCPSSIKGHIRVNGKTSNPIFHVMPYDGIYGEDGQAIYKYYIDSQEALNYFINKLKKYKLNETPRKYIFDENIIDSTDLDVA